MKKTKQQELIRIKFWISMIAFVVVISLMKYFLIQTPIDIERTGGIWEKLFVFIAFALIVPIFTIKHIFKEKLSDYYLCFKFEKWDLIRFLVLAIIFLGTLYYAVIYLEKGRIVSTHSLVSVFGFKFLFFIDFLITPIILLSREFFFRGFLLKNSIDFLGVSSGIALNTVLFLVFFFVINIFPGQGILSFFGDWQQVLMLSIFSLISTYLAFSSRTIVYSFLFSWAYILLADLMLKKMVFNSFF